MIAFETTVASFILLLLTILSCTTVFGFAAVKIYELTGAAIDFGRKRIEQSEERFDKSSWFFDNLIKFFVSFTDF